MRRNFSQPLWTGDGEISGKTILLHAEQGLGDTIQFCRFVSLVLDRGAQVLLEVPTALLELMATEFGDSVRVLEAGKPLPDFDAHCPLLSLPLAFKTDLTNMPANIPYLSSASLLREKWTRKLGVKRVPRIGLAWSGNPEHKNDRNRSIGLKHLIPYLPPQFEYVSMQKDVREIDLESLVSSGIRHFGQELTDFTETAALCDLMDAVISVDTSVAHLSGALGKPTGVLLPYAPDWRWLLGREDSPWYPTMKLYRQARIGDWDSAMHVLHSDLLNCESVYKSLSRL